MLISKRIFILSLLSLSVFCDEELLPSISTKPNSLNAGDVAYYTFTVPSNIPERTFHLTFDTMNVGEDPSDPDIYISSTNSHPTKQNSQWACTALGQDVCIVPKENVTPDKKFYVTIHCPRVCQYKVTVRLTDEKEIYDGEGLTGDLEASQSQLFKFYVPSDSSTNSISVSLSLGTTNTSMVRMFLSKGSQLPTTQSYIRGFPSWLGLTARIYQSDLHNFCTDCTYKVMVTTNTPTTYTITFKTNKAITKIKGDRFDTYELVKLNERNCYEYTVQSPEETLQVNLNVYSGNSDIFVHPGNIPYRAQDFAFYSTQCLNEMITITPKQRQELNAVTGNYYICIYGRSPSSYNLLIYSEIEEGKEIEVFSGLTRTMNVKAGEVKFFRFKIDHKETPRNVKLHLISITGNADLYIKQCRMRRNERGKFVPPCSLTEANLEDSDVMKSVLMTSVDNVETQVDTSQCQGDDRRCFYLIAVKGIRNAKFSLTVLGENVEEVALAEGIPVFGHAKLYQYNHYVFHIEDPDTTTLRVQLTSLSGDADLFLSRVNPYCGCVLAERGSQLDNFLPDALIFYKERDGDLNNTYHISVFGFTEATYSLYYTTSSPNKEIRPTALYDGQPQTGIINGTSPERSIALYQFAVDFSETEPMNIWITLTPVSGKFQTYIAHDYIPTPQNFTWKLSPDEHQLQITFNDPNYKRDGTYNILVQRRSESNTGSASSFVIKYFTGTFLHGILEGQPEIGTLLENQFAYYKYTVFNLTTSVTVTLTPFSGNPDLFISIDDGNKAPSKKAYDYVSSTLGADSITITSTEFYSRNRACSRFITGCAIYIGVVCSSPQCSYSLEVSRKETMVTKLLDGVPQYSSSTIDAPSNFLINAGYNSNIVITAYPKKGSITLYANTVSRNNYIRNQNPPLPTKEKHTFISTSLANAHTISIPGSYIESCGADCQVYVSVYQTTENLPSSEYMIVSTTNITQLADSIPIIDRITEQTYKYYFINVPCIDCTLSIALTPLSQGDPDVFVSKGKERLPNADSYDFKSTRYRGEFLQISKSDDYFERNPKENMQGPYTIAIFGQQNCTYSLAITTSAAMVQELSLGIPVKAEVRQGSISYFVFYSWKLSSIRFSLSIRSGRAILRANAVKDMREVDVISVLPKTELHSTWSSSRSSSLNSLIIKNDDSDYIHNGVYLLAVEAIEHSIYETIVEYDDDYHYTYLTLLEPYRIHLKSGEVKRMAFEVQSRAKITMNIYNIYGNIEGKVYKEKDSEEYWALTGLRLVIGPNDKRFKLGTYYASFTAKEDSEFIVTISNSIDTMFTLGEGLPMRSEIWTNTSAYFYYSIPTINTHSKIEGRFSISVNFLDPVIDPKVYIKRITKDNPSMPNANNKNIEISEDPDTAELGGTYSFSQVSGISVAIAVTGQVESDKAAFDITAWTSGVILMAPRQTYTQELHSIGESHIYEVNINKAGQLLIEVIPCVGEVEFTVSKNLAQLNDRKYDLKEADLSKGRLFGRIKAPVGNYYIAVRRVGVKEEKRTKYTIRTIVKESSREEEVEDYYVEDYGNINYLIEKDKIYLKWGKVFRRVDGKTEEIEAKYKIYMTDEEDVNMYTVCGIKMGEVEKIKEVKTNSYTFKLSDKHLNKNLVFNILAQVKDEKKKKHEKREKQSLAYNPIRVQLQEAEGASYIIFWLALPIIVVLGGIAIYYCIKYKRTKKQLAYEMQDARNLAQISSEAAFPTGKLESYTEMSLNS